MKKLLLCLLFIVTSVPAFAQTETLYNAYKPGLSLRDKPSAEAILLGTVPYGEKVTATDRYLNPVAVTNEGMSGSWIPVEYKGTKGFVVGIYLLEFPPPLAKVKTMKEYFAQLSKAVGPALSVSNGKEDTDAYSGFEKQLYKNGCEVHQASFYETFYNTYFLPQVTMQQGFVLVRLLAEFDEVFAHNDTFPTETRSVKVKNQSSELEKKIEVRNLCGGESSDKIVVNYSGKNGGEFTFEMYTQNGQLVISLGGGV